MLIDIPCKGESHWNVRKALKIWKEDDKWEKRQSVVNGCNVSAEEAEQLLNNHHWDVAGVILFWNKQKKKPQKTEPTEGKQTTTGSTEMQVIKKSKGNKLENEHQSSQ